MMAEFDPYSQSYRELVTKSVRVSGEPAEYFAAYKARYMARRFAPSSFRTVLDYGCGVGTLAEQLKVQMPEVRIDGFDPSAESLERVPGSLREQGRFDCDLAALGNSYDLVVVANVLHHVQPSNRQAVLAQAFRMLGPGGRLVIFEHNSWNPLTRWAVSQCPFDKDAILLHSSEVRSLLLRAGFMHLLLDFVVFFPRWLSPLRPLEKALGWLPFGAQYAFSGVKPA